MPPSPEEYLDRQAKRRLAIIRHVEEVTGNVSLTCRYYGISRPAYYTWYRRYQAEGIAGLRRPFQRHQDLPHATHFTAIDDCTRLRVLRVYPRCDQKTAIGFLDYVLERLPFRVETIQTDNGIDTEEFYRMLDGIVIDEVGVFNDKLQEWEDYYNTAPWPAKPPTNASSEKLRPRCNQAAADAHRDDLGQLETARNPPGRRPVSRSRAAAVASSAGRSIKRCWSSSADRSSRS
jgi:hypothetical protein